MRACDGAEHPLDAGGHARLVDRALEEAGTNPGVRDALGEVADDQVRHRIGEVETGPGAADPKVVGDIRVGVRAGGYHDGEVDLSGDRHDPGDVSAQTDHSRIDDRVDPRRLDRAQLRDGVVDPGLLVPLAGQVLLDIGSEDEDVLVHQSAAEGTGVDGAPDRGDVGQAMKR